MLLFDPLFAFIAVAESGCTLNMAAKKDMLALLVPHLTNTIGEKVEMTLCVFSRNCLHNFPH